MFRRKYNLWKAAVVVGGVLFLALMTLVTVSVADAHGGVSGATIDGTVTLQGTPTEDATVTALNKEKLFQDIAQQQHTLGNWFWSNGAAVISSLVLAIAGAFTLFRYLRDQRSEREKQREDRKAELEKRAEERFQAVCVGLGAEREEAKIGAAITLRTFLRPGYEQFYSQVFELAVVHLRLRKADLNIPEGVDTYFPQPPDSLSQALITIFKESFPLVRRQEKKASQLFDATGIQLDGAYLAAADLKYAWMPWASLRGANLELAKLCEANLHSVRFDGADLSGADLSGALLTKVNFSKANLHLADFSRARLRWADLSGANLTEADLSDGRLREVNLNGADLTQADLSNADLSGVRHFDAVRSLKDTDLYGVKGLTKEQLEACKAKGAIVDEATMASAPHAPVSSPPSAQSTDTQTPSATPTPLQPSS